MISRLLTIYFLLSVSLSAQNINIYDFSGGLNTKSGLFHMKPNQARECLNWDLSDEIGALRVRNGYTDYGYKNDTNSLKFIYTHYYRDGRKELFGISKSDTASWGTLYRSGDKNNLLDTSIYNFLYTGAQWSGVSWKDKVILSNGKQRPLIWDGDVCKPMSIPAPGCVDAVPINENGNLNGKYRYYLHFKIPDPLHLSQFWKFHITATYSVLTPEITVNNENILLFHFPMIQDDSLWPYGDWSEDTSTVEFMILRTKDLRGHNTIDTGIHFYPINFYDSTGGIDTGYIKLSMRDLDTFTWYDTIPDSYLGESLGYTVDVRLSNAFYNWSRFGSPNFMNRVTSSIYRKKKVNLDTLATGDSVLKVLYAVTYFDSANTMESDTGRVFAIVPHAEDDTMYYRISIPPPPPYDSGLQRIIYKAFMTKHTIYGDSIMVSWKWLYPISQILYPAHQSPYVKGIDTIITPFYQIAVIGNKDSIYFTDSVLWDSVSSLGQFYTSRSAPPRMKGAIIQGDRVWAYQDSKIMSSYLDSLGYWGQWDWYAFNLDDGDEITTIAPDREYINVYKNKSQHVLTRQSDGSYTTGWTVRGRGCVAPKSVQFYDGGIIYLDENGVYYETAMPAKDKGTQRNPLSAPIADLIDYPVSQLKDAASFMYKDKYMLSFPAKDTTYVYDFKVGAWSIYNFAFVAAINYDTISNAGLVPSSNMLFITGEDSVVYRFDTTHTDNGRAIFAKWKSGPIMPEHISKLSEIEKMGFAINGDYIDTAFSYILYNARDSITDSVKITPNDIYYIDGTIPRPSNYFYIAITNGLLGYSLKINGIDIWTKTVGLVPEY